jgi:hypothetical protein
MKRTASFVISILSTELQEQLLLDLEDHPGLSLHNICKFGPEYGPPASVVRKAIENKVFKYKDLKKRNIAKYGDLFRTARSNLSLKLSTPTTKCELLGHRPRSRSHRRRSRRRLEPSRRQGRIIVRLRLTPVLQAHLFRPLLARRAGIPNWLTLTLTRTKKPKHTVRGAGCDSFFFVRTCF